MSDNTKVLYELDGDVAIITLHDPATMNACGVDMAQEMTRAFERAAGEARAIVLTGTGKGFCSGANLGSTASNMSGTQDPAQMDAGAALESTYNPLVTTIRDLPVPLVTAVNGAAAGIGCSFALLKTPTSCKPSAGLAWSPMAGRPICWRALLAVPARWK